MLISGVVPRSSEVRRLRLRPLIWVAWLEVVGVFRMPCYTPLVAFQTRSGSPLFFGSTPSAGSKGLYVPCGKCVGCRLDYSLQWGIRCEHEMKYHAISSFLTLTYSDQFLPSDLSLNHEHFVDFFKRLRERLRRDSRPLIRFFMCGEYGDEFSRPHYHSLIFGFYPEDAVYFKTTKAGHRIYTSKFLDTVWGLGSVFVGAATRSSASYVARYIMKKDMSGEPMREILDVTSGEIIYRKHEYCKMSKRPRGIGANFVRDYGAQLLSHDYVYSDGAKVKLPRFYTTLLDEIAPLMVGKLKEVRMDKAFDAYNRMAETAENKYDVRRFRAEEVVKRAQIRSLKRS